MVHRHKYSDKHQWLETPYNPNLGDSMNTATKSKIERFIDAYVATALWSSTDDKGNPLDSNYSRTDIAPEALDVMAADCRKFFAENEECQTDPDSAGHDFWLTRNHHGAGFWDGDWEEEMGEKLTEASRKCGESNLYVGDDGQLYIM